MLYEVQDLETVIKLHRHIIKLAYHSLFWWCVSQKVGDQLVPKAKLALIQHLKAEKKGISDV